LGFGRSVQREIDLAKAAEGRDLDKDLEVAADALGEHAKDILLGQAADPAGDPQEGAPTEEAAPTEGEDGEPASPKAEEDPAPKTP
jgi:hypothetical protein